VLENDLFFAANSKSLRSKPQVEAALLTTVPSTGFWQSQCNHRRYRRQILLTGACVPHACAAAGRFGCACATAFHVFYRLHITNFSLLESTPNGVNYMDIGRFSLHGGFRLPDIFIMRKRLVAYEPQHRTRAQACFDNIAQPTFALLSCEAEPGHF